MGGAGGMGLDGVAMLTGCEGAAFTGLPGTGAETAGGAGADGVTIVVG